MAVVPTYERQVKAAPAPGPYQTASGATPDAFGAGVARGQAAMGASLGQLADQVADYAVKETAERNNLDLKNRDNQYERSLNEILYGNPETGAVGYYNMQGDAALKALPEVKQKMIDARKVASDGANDYVSKVLGINFDDKDNRTGQKIGAFFHQERTRATETANNASMALAVNSVQNDPASQSVSEEALKKAEGIASYNNNRLQNGPEAALTERMKHRTAVFKGRFDGALSMAEKSGNFKVVEQIIMEANKPESLVAKGVQIAMLEAFLKSGVESAALDLAKEAGQPRVDGTVRTEQEQKDFIRNSNLPGKVRQAALAEKRRQISNAATLRSEKRAIESADRDAERHDNTMRNEGRPGKVQPTILNAIEKHTDDKGITDYNKAEEYIRNVLDGKDEAMALQILRQRRASAEENRTSKRTREEETIADDMEVILDDIQVSGKFTNSNGTLNIGKMNEYIRTLYKGEGASRKRRIAEDHIKRRYAESQQVKAVQNEIEDRADRHVVVAEQQRKIVQGQQKEALLKDWVQMVSQPGTQGIDPVAMKPEEVTLLGQANVKWLKKIFDDKQSQTPTRTDPTIMDTLIYGKPVDIVKIGYAELKASVSDDEWNTGWQLWLSARTGKGDPNVITMKDRLVLAFGTGNELNAKAKKRFAKTFASSTRLAFDEQRRQLEQPGRKLKFLTTVEQDKIIYDIHNRNLKNGMFSKDTSLNDEVAVMSQDFKATLFEWARTSGGRGPTVFIPEGELPMIRRARDKWLASSAAKQGSQTPITKAGAAARKNTPKPSGASTGAPKRNRATGYKPGNP